MRTTQLASTGIPGKHPVGVFVGLATLDVIHVVDAPAGRNQKVTAERQFISAGGPAANAAVTFAALGGTAILVSALGGSAIAEVIGSDLQGVRVIDALPDTMADPPISAIAVNRRTGERSVTGIDASALQVPKAPDLSTTIGNADVVLIDGHHPVLTRAATESANAAMAPIVIDAGRWKPSFEEAIPRASVVICSADFRVPGSPDSVTTARALIEAHVPTVITTHGADPIRWWHGARNGSIPPPRIKAVDTLGAGDVFHGAYCYFASVQSGSPGQHPADLAAQHISAAARIAAIKCANLGPRSWLSRLQLEK